MNIFTQESKSKKFFSADIQCSAYVQSTYDYFPFGSPLPGRGYDGAGYKFGFNGQEKDEEVYGDGSFYTLEFRSYDSRVGRFLKCDPLTKEYPSNSPYSYAENSVIQSIDLEGSETKKTTGYSADFSDLYDPILAQDQVHFTLSLNLNDPGMKIKTDPYQFKVTQPSLGSIYTAPSNFEKWQEVMVSDETRFTVSNDYIIKSCATGGLVVVFGVAAVSAIETAPAASTIIDAGSTAASNAYSTYMSSYALQAATGVGVGYITHKLDIPRTTVPSLLSPVADLTYNITRWELWINSIGISNSNLQSTQTQSPNQDQGGNQTQTQTQSNTTNAARTNPANPEGTNGSTSGYQWSTGSSEVTVEPATTKYY